MSLFRAGLHSHFCRYSGGAKRLRSGSESEAAVSTCDTACKSKAAAECVPAPARQHGSPAAAQQGCHGNTGGSARRESDANPAQNTPQEAAKAGDGQQQQQQQPGSATAVPGPRQPRKKVPRIYFATRTHSQIAQVSRCSFARPATNMTTCCAWHKQTCSPCFACAPFGMAVDIAEATGAL